MSIRSVLWSLVVPVPFEDLKRLILEKNPVIEWNMGMASCFSHPIQRHMRMHAGDKSCKYKNGHWIEPLVVWKIKILTITLIVMTAFLGKKSCKGKYIEILIQINYIMFKISQYE
jgi:hypothetical protein